jgi:hypothetical protein
VTRGLAPDGWTRADVPAVLRVYGEGPVDVRVTASAPDVKVLRSFTIGSEGGVLGPTESRELSFRVCAHGKVDLPIRTDSVSPVRRIPTRPPYAAEFRFVGIRLSRIAAQPASGGC